MLYLYFILSAIIILVAARCLRSRFDSYVPVLTMSFAISAVITIIVNLFVFYNCGVTYEKTEKRYLAVFDNINNGRINTYNLETNVKGDKYDTDDSLVYFPNTNGKLSYVIKTHYIRHSSYFPSWFETEDSCIEKFYLNKKDYELLDSIKSNAKKG